MENKLPKLNGLFFNVIETAIQNTAWKRADFDKVAEVEGQLRALSFFYEEYYKGEQAKAKNNLDKIAVPVEKVAPVEIEDPATKDPTPEIAPGADPKVPEETPMPKNISNIVEAGLEAAKKTKPANKSVKVSESALPEVAEYIKNP